MQIISRHIRNTVIGATTIVVLVLLGIESFMELIGQLTAIGKANYGLAQALVYVPLQLPADLYQLFPMAGFLGSLIGLGRLASSSELIVMRAAGVSTRQILWAVIKTALLMLFVVTVIGEAVAPMLQKKAELYRSVALNKIPNWRRMSGLWLHHENNFVHIAGSKTSTELTDITRYHFTPNFRLQWVDYAPVATLENSRWVMHNITRTHLSKNQVTISHINREPFRFVLNPQLLRKSTVNLGQESILGLLEDISLRGQSGLVVTQYEFDLWQRIIQPLTTILMICLGIPFIFGSLRSASMGQRVLVGIIVGFGFYMLNQLFGPITLVYQFPPYVAALLPTIICLLFFSILWRRI